MKRLTTLARAAALAATLLASAGAASPAVAAAADVALIKEYVGNWTGRGTLTGSSSESVRCRLALTEGNAGRVNYSGRCTLAGTNLSINGTIAYNDASRRYEASMTSDIGFSPGAVVGRARGKDIVFSLKDSGTDPKGNNMNISANLVLGGGKINVQFEVSYPDTGDTMKAQVPFTK